MADSEREIRERQWAAVEREMSRRRAADGPDEAEETREHDLIDIVTKEQRRERDAEDDDPPS